MKMKIPFMSLVLALMLMSGSALRCYLCNSSATGKCTPKNDICTESEEICASGRFFDLPSFNLITFKRCMPASLCYHLLKRKDYKDVKCCVTNFCN